MTLAQALAYPFVSTNVYFTATDEVTHDNCRSAHYRFVIDIPIGAVSATLTCAANVDDYAVAFVNGQRVTADLEAADLALFPPPSMTNFLTDYDRVDAQSRPLLSWPTRDTFTVSMPILQPGLNELVFAVHGDASQYDPTGLEFEATVTHCYPTPSISSLSPATYFVGTTPPPTLDVFGSGFTPVSVVRWGGANLTTSYVSSGHLRATPSNGFVASHGNRTIRVFTPCGGLSNSLQVAVEHPTPVVSTISPSSVLRGIATNLTICGSGFGNFSTVQVDGTNVAVTSASATKLTITVPGALLAPQGSLPITVTNPSPGGGTDSGNVIVTNPPPMLASTSATSVTAGDPNPLNLTLSGANFVPNSSVTWNGVTLTSFAVTYVNSTTLQVVVPPALFSTPGTVTVCVVNPGPGGGASCLSFTVFPGGNPNLNTWTSESIPGGGAAPAWSATASGNAVTQTSDSEPAFLCQGDGSFINMEVSVDVTVDPSATDDDFFGFALGFDPGDSANAGADYLLIDWKRTTESVVLPGCNGISTFQSAARGLALSRVTGVPTPDELWSHSMLSTVCSPAGSGVTELARGTSLGQSGWFPGAVYDFRIQFRGDRVKVYVGGTLEFDITGSFSNGGLCFYTFSQSDVTFSNLATRSIPGALASIATIGTGCNAPDPAPILEASEPALGTNFSLIGNLAPASSVGTLYFSPPPANDLVIIPGCTAYLDRDQFFSLGGFLTGPGGGWTRTFAIPIIPVLAGVPFRIQAVMQSPNPTFFFALTNGVEGVIGY